MSDAALHRRYLNYPGAYAAATGLVHPESLVDALPRALPPYRRHTLAANAAAIRAGAAEVAPDLAPAWPVEAAR